MPTDEGRSAPPAGTFVAETGQRRGHTAGGAVRRPARPRPRPSRRYRVAALGGALLVVAATGLRFLPGSPLAAAPPGTIGPASSGPPASVAAWPSVTTAPPPPPSRFRYAPVRLSTKGFVSWALLDRRSGEIVGSSNLTALSTTASMIKPWLAADYLRRAAERAETPSATRLKDLEIMIRDSHNGAAERTYQLNGRTASIKRLITICGLTDSKATPGLWSKTYVSARDTVRMGQCLADGRAAGPLWTPWLLDMMRRVRGTGDFGVRRALPPAEAAMVAIKNGWLLRDEDNRWHVSCLAIGADWVMSVLQRYPSQGTWDTDFAHARQVCQEVAAQLINPAAGADGRRAMTGGDGPMA